MIKKNRYCDIIHNINMFGRGQGPTLWG